jgi:DNA primase
MGSNMAECHPVAFRFVMEAEGRSFREAVEMLLKARRAWPPR